MQTMQMGSGHNVLVYIFFLCNMVSAVKAIFYKQCLTINIYMCCHIIQCCINTFQTDASDILSHMHETEYTITIHRDKIDKV